MSKQNNEEIFNIENFVLSKEAVNDDVCAYTVDFFLFWVIVEG